MQESAAVAFHAAQEPGAWACENKSVKTLRLPVDVERLHTEENSEALDRAAAILRAGGLVALPTETVYGLGANAFDQAAVKRIFAAKARPAWDPVIVHVASEAMLDELVCDVSARARLLIKQFWPGPLTLLLPRAASVPDCVTAGRPLVGVRMPAHPVAIELIRRAGVPVAAPSANRFGHTSPTTAAHVLDDLDGRIDVVLDAGPTVCGVESTVLDPAGEPMTIYRPGAATAEAICAAAGAVAIFQSSEPLRKMPVEALPSPGVGLRHYAPRARLVLIEGLDATTPLAAIESAMATAARQEANELVGAMLPDGVTAPALAAAKRVFPWGRWDAPEELAARLYSGLRALDAAGCTAILCPLPAAGGLGAALHDRLRKAAR